VIGKTNITPQALSNEATMRPFVPDMPSFSTQKFHLGGRIMATDLESIIIEIPQAGWSIIDIP
jgi:hypothetical protein